MAESEAGGVSVEESAAGGARTDESSASLSSPSTIDPTLLRLAGLGT
jgi:hypothetical protein